GRRRDGVRAVSPDDVGRVAAAASRGRVSDHSWRWIPALRSRPTGAPGVRPRGRGRGAPPIEPPLDPGGDGARCDSSTGAAEVGTAGALRAGGSHEAGTRSNRN